ncbi:hypothetical protein Tco_0886979 [Tanacetum coccineum]
MADNRTMAQLLKAPTEGYEDAIVVPEITANNFEIKHGLLNLIGEDGFDLLSFVLVLSVACLLIDSFPYLDYSKLVHLYLCFNLARAICNCLEVYHDHVIIALMACTYPGRCDSSRRSFGRIMVLSRKEAGYADECRKLLEDQPLIIRFANLPPLELSDFDISLGMNWLAVHRAPIVGHTNRVIFGDLDNPEFIYLF